ncbi:unnamed protein product [Urochloa humidicola]
MRISPVESCRRRRRQVPIPDWRICLHPTRGPRRSPWQPGKSPTASAADAQSTVKASAPIRMWMLEQ